MCFLLLRENLPDAIYRSTIYDYNFIKSLSNAQIYNKNRGKI